MGRPIHYDGTSLGLTSRSGLSDDVYLELSDGSGVPLSALGNGRIRLNLGLGRYEQSIDGGPWVPLGSGGSPTMEPTGFVDRADSEIWFSSALRRVQISPVAGSYDYWIQGVLYRKWAPDQVVIPDVEGLHFIYFDGDTLMSTTVWSVDLLRDYAIVAIAYWDTSAGAFIYCADERHEFMPWQTHYELHTCFGTQYLSGLALTNILADQSGALDTHAQFGVQAGSILDEDLVHAIATKAAPAQIPVFHRSGAAGDWNRDIPTNFPVKPFAPGQRLAYNAISGGVWTQIQVPSNGQFVLSHIFATNEYDLVTNGIIAIQGQASYANLTAARQGANAELLRLLTDGLPLAEFKPIASVIFETSTAYGNAIKARIRSTDTGATYVDWRASRLSPVIVSLPGGFDPTAYHADIPGEIAATPPKAPTSKSDLMLIEDSAASWAKKSATLAASVASTLTANAPVNVDKSAASAGVGTEPARSDHKHDASTAAAVAASVGQANGEGTATTLARSDHTHQHTAGTPVDVGTANAQGAGTNFSRHDHVHAGLTRNANDFAVFANKAAPVAADLLLIEDSAAGGAKKNISIGSLPTGSVNESNVIYVGKHGNDGNSGLNQGAAKLTIAAGLAACAAPGVNNQWRVEVLDGGTYSESIAIPSYVHLHAPSARLVGHVALSDYSSAILRSIEPSSDGPSNACVYYNGSAQAFVRAQRMVAYVSTNATYCVRHAGYSASTLIVDVDYAANANTIGTSAVFFNDFQGRMIVWAKAVECSCMAFYSDNVTLSGLRDVFHAGRVVCSGSIPLGTNAINTAHELAVCIDTLDLASRAAPWYNGASGQYPISGRIGEIANYSTSYPATITPAVTVNRHEKSVNLHNGNITPSSLLGSSYYWGSNASDAYVSFAFSVPVEAVAWKIYMVVIPDTNETNLGGSINADAANNDQAYASRTWTNANWINSQAGTANFLYRDDITAFFLGLLAGDSVRGRFAKRSGAASGTWYISHMVIEWIGKNG